MCELLTKRERRIFCRKRRDAEGKNGDQKSPMIDRCRRIRIDGYDLVRFTLVSKRTLVNKG